MNFRRFWRARWRFGRETLDKVYGEHKKRGIIRVALAGNPNAGKTCLFNAITGQRQRVGNYPGVTVETKCGSVRYKGKIFEFIDLPGTYSLSAYSQDEVVARDFVIKEKPDVVVDVIDATNLRRHLYLLLQFQEMGVPIVGALNMIDEAEAKGIKIEVEKLSEILGIPLVKTVGNKGVGVQDLLDKVLEVYTGKISSTLRHLNYGQHVEKAHNKIIEALKEDEEFIQRYPLHWIAIKLLEDDEGAKQKIELEHKKAEQVLEIVKSEQSWLSKIYNTDSRTVVCEQRYAYIHGALKETVKYPKIGEELDLTEKIDEIVLHKVLGIPIFLIVMFLIYQLTFRLGTPISELIRKGFGGLGSLAKLIIPDGILQDLIVKGIVSGVGNVIAFLPLVLLLMLGLALLEDTGYMARAAFVMDKFFHLFGLHGRSFIPFMVATGCAVPGVMSARLLANPKDRIVTILVTPFMMCSAKVPVVAMLAASFFPENSAIVFWSVWLASWVVAFLVALMFRKTLFRGEQTPFVMELPPYRLPSVKTVLFHMWEKAREYLKKAGTIILAAAIIIWFLFNFPRESFSSADINFGSTEVAKESYAFKIGKALEPALKLAGFDWKIGVSLLAGVAAKEVIVATLSILYFSENQTENNLQNSIKNDSAYSPLVGLALIIFVMFYTPCLATLAVVRKELNSWGWMFFQVFYTLILAYFLAVITFQLGSLLTF